MRSHATKPRPSLLQKASPFQSAVATFYPCLSNKKSKNIQYCVNKETTNRLYGECDRCVKCFWNILTLSQNWRADSLGSLSHTAFLRKKIYKVIHQKNNEDCMQASSWHFSWSEVRQPSVFCTCMYKVRVSHILYINIDPPRFNLGLNNDPWLRFLTIIENRWDRRRGVYGRKKKCSRWK